MPSAFVSYSWDDPGHIFWARGLAARLRTDGVATSVDKASAVPAEQLAEFMERAVLTHEYVLVVCTPKYKEMSEKRVAMRGYEGDIVTAQILTSGNQRKFIPLLRNGDWATSGPLWLSEYFIDLRGEGPAYEARYQELLGILLGTRTRQSQAIPVAAPPPPKAAVVSKSTPEAPVRIVGVIEEEVGQPRNNGTHMSTLYRVPLLLSRQVSSRWETIFEQLWNRSPGFATIRRASIARVYGDRLILNCTTLDEVQTAHREALLVCVGETNRIMAEKEADEQREKEDRMRASEAHRMRVHELVEKIRFDAEKAGL